MEKFKAATVQMNALKGNLEHNLDVHRHFTRKAAKNGCVFVLFPELSATAHYGDESVTEFAEEAGGGPVYETMLGLAEELDVTISYGFCEIAHGTYYNSQALVGPAGLIGIQRKVHASWDEYFHFRMGRTLEVLTTERTLQLYTSYHRKDVPGSEGAVYQSEQGFCIEAQHMYNSPNQPNFPSTVLRPGETYRSTTSYRFSAH